MLPLQENRALSRSCTFGIGGSARHFAEASTVEQMKDALAFGRKKNIPYFIFGKGSNCLFDDRGFNGIVIHNKIDFNESLANNLFHVGAGYSFSLLGSQTARQGFSGLEFASGIPGSVGGAIFMNAGANGNETCKSLISVDYLDEKGSMQILKREDLLFAYRTSSFQSMPGVIVGATFQLTPSSAARERQLEIIDYRKKTQPYGDKSAGCIFRNPSCKSAGALIDYSGLKGFRIGGAKVSEMHANFIVNAGNATAKDVQNLIHAIKERVKERTSIDLENEIRVVPYE